MSQQHFLRQNTSLAAKGALAHRLQRRTACTIKNSHQGAQNGRRGLERGLRSRQLSLNKFFDPSAPSMRKVDDGEKKERKEFRF